MSVFESFHSRNPEDQIDSPVEIRKISCWIKSIDCLQVVQQLPVQNVLHPHRQMKPESARMQMRFHLVIFSILNLN